MRVVSAEDETFESLSLPKNIVGNPPPLGGEEIGQPMYRLHDTTMNEDIVPGDLYVPSCRVRERSKLLKRIFPFIGKCSLEIDPPRHNLRCEVVFVRGFVGVQSGSLSLSPRFGCLTRRLGAISAALDQ
jgi:hypothetical protein